MSQDLESQSAAYWDEHNLGQSEDVTYWLAVPEIRRSVNRFMTGDPEKLYIQHFVESIRPHWPVAQALSVGCGAGELERGIASQGVARTTLGIDVSRASLAEAERLAAAQGLGEQVSYQFASAKDWLSDESRTYDLIFFHGVLHHLEDLEDIFQLAGERVRAGTPGLIYVDEYVGPSRHEWTSEHLRWSEEFFASVALDDRRTPEVWPPVALEDPTEMIRSSEIETLLSQHLTLVDRRPYYGNVVFPLVNAIKASRLGRYTELLAAAWKREHELVASGEIQRPHYVATVAASG